MGKALDWTVHCFFAKLYMQLDSADVKEVNSERYCSKTAESKAEVYFPPTKPW